MALRKMLLAGMCLSVTAAAAPPARAQSCTSSQDATVQCFVGTAVRTNLMSLRYGMNIVQFKAYGVAVSKILQTQHSYAVLLALASATSDALPPTNSDGTANEVAQDAAVNAMVAAAISSNLISIVAETNLQDFQWFTLDLVKAMNRNDGVMLSPGALFRIIDSYTITSTSKGTVNWTLANAGIAGAIDGMIAAQLLKIPTGFTAAQVKTFAQSLAQIIYNYRLATGRATL